MSEDVLYCANHPDRVTTLRCNRCDKPICPSCAVQTPVGYRCKECVRGQQKVFETARTQDFILAAVLTAVGTGIAITLLNFIGWWGFFVAPMAGGGLAEGIRRVTGARRSRKMPAAVIIGGVLGLLPHLWPLALLLFFPAGSDILGSLYMVLFPVVYAVLLVGAVVTRLQGIRL
ncbi:MAG: B-box zinc finger protein [Anaerolineales bacterium]|nr:B-box zinc finger protein [Anaerolineales bacterium]